MFWLKGIEKRQKKIYDSEIGHTAPEVVEPRERSKEGTNLTYQKTALEVGGFPGVKSVSYTHLDVYKRQVGR